MDTKRPINTSYQLLSSYDEPDDAPKKRQVVPDKYKELEGKCDKLSEDLKAAQPCRTSLTMWTAIGDHRGAIENVAKELKATLEKIKGHQTEFKSTFEHSSFEGLRKKVENVTTELSTYAKGSSTKAYRERMGKLCKDLEVVTQQCFPLPSPQARTALKQQR